MKVTIVYFDHDSMAVEEVVSRAVHNYGDDVQVTVEPESFSTSDILYFCMQKVVTHDQLAALFDEPHKYQDVLEEIKAKATNLAVAELERVIKDNEIRVK